MKRSKGKRKHGRLVFMLPILVIVVITLAGLYASAQANRPGTLRVEAVSAFGTSTKSILATATISSHTVKTPYNLSIAPGDYTVTFGQLEGYTTPSPKVVAVYSEKTSFAVGSYVPIPVYIGVSQTGFNLSRPVGIHDVTPFVWVDTGSQAVQLRSSVFNVVISPGQTYTHTFTDAGSYTVVVLGTSEVETLSVS